jgi:hypothetical protein
VAYFQPEVELSSGRVVAAGGREQGSSAHRRLVQAGRRAVGQVGGATAAAALAMLVAYGLWQVFRWGGHRHQALIGDLAFFPVNGAAAFCAWRVSLRKDLGRHTCRAWRLLSGALWLFLLGDEFIIMIPGTTSLRAAQIAVRLTGPPARVSGIDGMPVTFTVSVGIAESACCHDLPSLLTRADLAMYEAKRAGGGCWRIFEGTEHSPDPVLPTA